MWALSREPLGSFADYTFYAKVAQRFAPGRVARFRLRPAAGALDAGACPLAAQAGADLPPAVERDPADVRAPTALRDALSRALRAGPLSLALDVQICALPDDADAAQRDKVLDCTEAWDENECPWIEVNCFFILFWKCE